MNDTYDDTLFKKIELGRVKQVEFHFVADCLLVALRPRFTTDARHQDLQRTAHSHAAKHQPPQSGQNRLGRPEERRFVSGRWH